MISIYNTFTQLILPFLCSAILACEIAIDLGFLVDYSGSVENAKEEAAIKSLIIDSAMTFDISKDNTHVGFIPFSTYPYNDKKNMFNNSVVANIAAGDKTAQLNYLNEIVKPDPESLDNTYIRGNYILPCYSISAPIKHYMFKLGYAYTKTQSGLEYSSDRN